MALSKPKCYKRFIWMFNRLSEADIKKLYSDLSNIDWDKKFFYLSDVNKAYENWFAIFRKVIHANIPNRIVTIRPRDKPWMNGAIRKAIRKRNRLLKLFNKSKTQSAWEKYRQQRNFTTSLIRKNKVKYFEEVDLKLRDPCTGPMKWWGIVKALYGQKLHSSVPTLVDGAKLISDAKEKSEVFNEYFCSQSKIDDGSASFPREIIYFQNDVSLSNVRTTESEVLDLLKSVDIGKACGPDGIGNRILKLCADGISSSFPNLINLSLSEGKFPDAWKLANVTPIFKKDDRQSKVNYRPVSLLDSLSKITEKIVFTRLYTFLLEIEYLNPLQSGFRPGDSTVNQLVYLVHKIYDAFEKGKEIRMVFLDISKAFDKV